MTKRNIVRTISEELGLTKPTRRSHALNKSSCRKTSLFNCTAASPGVLTCRSKKPFFSDFRSGVGMLATRKAIAAR